MHLNMHKTMLKKSHLFSIYLILTVSQPEPIHSTTEIIPKADPQIEQI